MKKLAIVLLVLIQIAALVLLFTEYMRLGMFIIAISALSVSISRICISRKNQQKENI